MQHSVPDFAKGVYHAIKDSILQSRSAYARMDQESENEDDEAAISNSLFYSIQQHHAGEESIPLTESQAYSDRSQLLFDDEHSDDFVTSRQQQHSPPSIRDSDDYEEGPKPSAIYLEPPPTSSSIAETSGPKSLSESLLPVTTIPLGVTARKSERKYRDPIFAVLYILCMLVFIISGIIIALTTNSHAIERYARGSTFKAITDSAGIMAAMMLTSFVAGIIWISILRSYTKTIVWITIVSVPATLMGTFVWTIVESFQPNNLDRSLTVFSFFPLVTAVVYVIMIARYYQRVNKTAAAVQFACDILRYNPGIIFVSLLLLGIFVIFTIVWLTLFTRLWLMGYGNDTDGSRMLWVLNSNVYFWALFYIFVYLWSAALLINAQRFVLSSVTAYWYFHRHEPTSAQDRAWKDALARASSTSLGTLALAGLILALVQFLQCSSWMMRKYTRRNWPLVSIVSFILTYVEALVNQINHYTISLAGITGESFFPSAKSGTKIFRRNLLSGLLGDMLTKLILYVGSLVLGLTSGFGAYIYATHNLRTPHGFIVGMISALGSLYISQFFSYAMMSIVDATFLCYAIDLDTGMVHSSKAHNIFSGFD